MDLNAEPFIIIVNKTYIYIVGNFKKSFSLHTTPVTLLVCDLKFTTPLPIYKEWTRPP